jgi:peptidoglycan/xylan/chitin deacetylase (PgdA/CDA1 family)
MSWDEALGLEPLVRLAPHTRTHRSLPTLPDNELAGEIRGSREDVEEKTGRAATLFAYPYGHLDHRVVAAVSSAGFTAACSARIGTNDSVTPPLELCRYEVRGDRSFARFQQAFVHAG